jgi:DNA replicative helicase MCM subunit Mcm2 (Cdc46/Mcm family)
MARASNQELTDRFIEFYRNHCQDDIAELARQYPNERRSLYVDYDDLYQFDADLAEDYRSQPDQIQEYAEEALRLFDLPADIKLGNAHVRIKNLPETLDSLSVQDNYVGKLVAVKGIISEADDKAFAITDAAFECQRCGTMNYLPQSDGELQEPHECQGCERQGPFRINFDQSEFIDEQTFTLQSTDVDVSDDSEPLAIDVLVEDDLVGVSAGDYVTVNGVLHIEQKDDDSSLFEPYLDAVSITSTDKPSPSFESVENGMIDMDSYLTVATQTLAGLPDTAREPGAKGKLITPFLEALGWNKFDNDEWRFEYTDSKTSKRVDYALFADGSQSPDMLVEAKQVTKQLDRHESQIYDYLRIFSAEYGLLTNGEIFRVYHNLDEGEPEHIATLDLHDIPEAGIIDNLQPSAFSGDENTPDTADSTTEYYTEEMAAELDVRSRSDRPLADMVNQMEDSSEHPEGVPIKAVIEKITGHGFSESQVERQIEKCRRQGEVYEPKQGHLRST